MQQFMELGFWSWFILALGLFLLEFIVPGVHFLWFGVAAAVVGAGVMVLGDFFSWPMQLVVFVVLAITSVFVFRRYSNPKAVKSDLPDLNARGAQYIGTLVTVAEAIEGGRGKVRVGDTLWQANGPDAPIGSSVKVVGVDGTVLAVELA